MTARDLLLSKRLPGNPFDQQAAAQRALAELANREIVVPQLSGIAQDFGLINAGTIVMGNGLPLGAGFTGVMQFADPLEWPAGSGKYWHYAGFNADVMMFGISAADGKLYAAGGKMTVDSSAISMNDLLYALTQQASDSSGDIFYSRFGMDNSDASEPRPTWEYTSEPGTNLVANPGFETGDFTGWTVLGETWTAATDQVHSGSYSAKVVNSGPGVQGGAIESNQVAVTSRTDYEVSAWYRYVSGTLVYYGGRVMIEWYDAASGGSYISTSQLLLPFTQNDWMQGKGIVRSPGNALGAKVIAVLTTFGSGVAYFDDISFATIDPSTRITMEPDVHVRGADLYVEDNKAHAGDEAAYKTWSNTAATQELYRRVITSGEMGAYGKIVEQGVIHLHNVNAGAGRTLALDFIFGGTTLFGLANASAAVGNGQESIFRYMLTITNQGATNAQIVTLWFSSLGGTVYGTTVSGLSTDGSRANTSSEDTTADLDLVINGTMSTAHAGLSMYRQSVDMFGPYWHGA